MDESFTPTGISIFRCCCAFRRLKCSCGIIWCGSSWSKLRSLAITRTSGTYTYSRFGYTRRGEDTLSLELADHVSPCNFKGVGKMLVKLRKGTMNRQIVKQLFRFCFRNAPFQKAFGVSGRKRFGDKIVSLFTRRQSAQEDTQNWELKTVILLNLLTRLTCRSLAEDPSSFPPNRFASCNSGQILSGLFP